MQNKQQQSLFWKPLLTIGAILDKINMLIFMQLKAQILESEVF